MHYIVQLLDVVLKDMKDAVEYFYCRFHILLGYSAQITLSLILCILAVLGKMVPSVLTFDERPWYRQFHYINTYMRTLK